MAEQKNIDIRNLEVNKGQIEGLPKNPRFIRDERFEALKKSIEDAPEMLALRELLVYPHEGKYVVIGGNMRLRACTDIGYKEVPCKVLDPGTPVEKLREYVHPTQKPITLAGRGITNSSAPYAVVLDLFGGSGSTMMACEQLDRRCYTMEFDPHYCDVIIARWERLTGKQAIKIIKI